MPDKDQRPGSVFLSAIPQPDQRFVDPQLAEKWDRIFKERSEVLKALEQARAAGIIGHSLDAKVVLHTQNGLSHESPLLDLLGSDPQKLEDLLIVSQAEAVPGLNSFLDQVISARESGNRGMHSVVDLPDGRRVISFDAELLDSFISVFRADGGKCERCWKYDTEVGKDPAHPTVCARCARVLNAGAPG